MSARFFASAAGFRKWLAANHARARELVVGFHKKDSGRGGITYAEALDEALCHGWIDGVRHRLDESSYSIRFTPRRPRSIWSRVNIGHVERLRQAGRMAAPGLKAYAAREAARSGIYSFENAPRELADADAQRFRQDRGAWEFFQKQPPGYRRVATWWVVSAKQDATRQRRLDRLMLDSRAGRRLELVTGKKSDAARPVAAR